MNRNENLYLLYGTISTLDDTQLGELYAYAVHMQKRVTSPELVFDSVAGAFVTGVLGMLAGDGQKDMPATPSKRLAKHPRTRKAKVS